MTIVFSTTVLVSLSPASQHKTATTGAARHVTGLFQQVSDYHAIPDDEKHTKRYRSIGLVL